MIHLKDITKTYRTAKGPVDALGGVSMDVEPGEFIAVQGPSGCGKSTLLLIAGGLATPTSGNAVVAGEDLTGISKSALAQFRGEKIGFVFQMFHLLPYLTVSANVAAAALQGQRAAAKKRAAELLDQFQLGDRLTHRPPELSAGERQRVAIARAMVNRPKLILADEPTGNLDPESATGVLDLLKDFHADGGTILLVTHQESAAEYAERTVLLQDGMVQQTSA